MTDFKKEIYAKLERLLDLNLSSEERAVLSVLMPTFRDESKVTQIQIARTERWLGCHPKHEADIRMNKMETTTRQVRQIINDLRNKYGVPIISDRGGYWICRSEQEVNEYLSRIELQVKATAKSHFATYRAMKAALNVTNTFFESHQDYE